MSISLSEHFAVREIFGDHKPTTIELHLAEQLARRCLEPARRVLGAPLHITDGWRDEARHNELKRRGYKPYRYSDHSYALPWHPFGVGAADFVKLARTRTGHTRREAITEDEYHALVAALPGDVYGQLIWYRKRGHVHLSNARSVLFSDLALAHFRLPERRKTYIADA